jgi:hypothetical protein
MKKKLASVCICTIASLLFFSSSSFADLVLNDGTPSGQWYNPERSGEGFLVEMIDTGNSNNAISVTMFSFDAAGKQVWLGGILNIAPAAESARIQMFQYDGPMWGAAYNPDDLNSTEAGFLTVNFPTCDSATFRMESTGPLSSYSYGLVRISSLIGIECNDPPPEQSFPVGKWDGDGVCFNVAEDGQSISGAGSSCANGATAWTNLNGLSEDTGDCNVEITCAGAWPIDDGSFACVNNEGDLIVGQFGSSNSASGLAYNERGGVDDYCVAAWTASPN